MKNALRVIAIVVVAALLFGVGYSMGSSKGINITVQYSNAGTATDSAGSATVNTNTTPVQTTAAPETTAAPQTTAAPETTVASDKTDAPAADETDAPAADDNGSSIPSSTAEIVKAYNDAVNNTKAYTGTINARKVNDMTLNLDDCSIGFLTSTINGILQGLVSDSDKSWTFENCVATQDDGSTRDLDYHVPPSRRQAALTEAGVASASATDNGDGTYTMKIALVAETSSYDGTNTVNPVHNESVVDPLNLATLDISPAKITSANMNYPGTTLEATVNEDGLLTKLIVELPMAGNGVGSLSGASLEAVISGGNVDTYEFSY